MSTGASFASAIYSTPQKPIHPDASTEPGASRRSSRRRDSGLYDPNKPVLLHEDIVDGNVATVEVLTDFGFALCDADADTWFHPHTQFQCQSGGELCCRWKRDTLLRCSVTTDITRKDDTMRWVTDLEPRGSLQHPPCLNRNCRLDKPYHIMRLERKQLVSRVLSDPEKDALLSKKRAKWCGQFQDEYPMPVGVMPFSKDPSEGLSKKRQLRRPPKADNSMTAISHTTEAARPNSIPGPIGHELYKEQNYDAGEARQIFDIKPSLEPGYHHPRPTTSSHRLTSLPAGEKSDDDIREGRGLTRLTDHYLVTAQEFDRMQAKTTALRARIADLEQEVYHEGRGVLMKENANLKKERDSYKEEARAAKELVEELKTKVLGLFG